MQTHKHGTFEQKRVLHMNNFTIACSAAITEDEPEVGMLCVGSVGSGADGGEKGIICDSNTGSRLA